MIRESNFILIFLLIVTMISCQDVSEVKVPSTKEVFIKLDGQIDENEWDGSRTVDISPDLRLQLLQTTEDFHLAVRNKENVARYVDVFIKKDSGKLINLHASMQLGERLLTGAWNDTIPEWNWGNNTEWSANTVEIISHNDEVLFREIVKPYDGFEFRISKKWITESFLLRIEIKDFEGKEDDVVFPSGSKRDSFNNWIRIDLNEK